MIIQVRGNHGSGKSTAIRGVIDHYGVHQVVTADADDAFASMSSSKNEIIGSILNGPDGGIFVVGDYRRPTGGCDPIKKQEYITDRVKHFHGLGYHVLFEGILASITFQRYADVADLVGKDNMVFAFLATSREQSFTNIAERRKSSTVVRGPFKEDLFDKKVQMLRRCRQRYLDGGYRVLDCPFGEASKLLVEALERG